MTKEEALQDQCRSIEEKHLKEKKKKLSISLRHVVITWLKTTFWLAANDFALTSSLSFTDT